MLLQTFFDILYLVYLLVICYKFLLHHLILYVDRINLSFFPLLLKNYIIVLLFHLLLLSMLIIFVVLKQNTSSYQLLSLLLLKYNLFGQNHNQLMFLSLYVFHYANFLLLVHSFLILPHMLLLMLFFHFHLLHLKCLT